MSLNIKALIPAIHPEVSYPEKALEGRSDCGSNDESIKSWSDKKFALIKKKKKIADNEATPLKKLNII